MNSNIFKGAIGSLFAVLIGLGVMYITGQALLGLVAGVTVVRLFVRRGF